MSSVEKTFECCPPFDPIPWDDQTFEWKNKQFIKDKVCTLFYMPMNFGGVMKRLDRKITSAGAIIPDNLGLSDHTSKWNMDLYLAVDKEIPEADNTTLSGKFYSKVFEGPFRDTGKWMSDYENLAKSKGLIVTYHQFVYNLKRYFSLSSSFTIP
jgi:hypothetical protein